MSEEAHVGQQIKQLREALGFSQADLAHEMTDRGFANWYAQTLTKIEQGRRGLRWEEGLAIAAIFGVSPEDLGGAGPIDEESAAVRRLVRALEAASVRAGRAFDEVRQADANLHDLLESLEADDSWATTALRVHGAESTARRLNIVAKSRPAARPIQLGD